MLKKIRDIILKRRPFKQNMRSFYTVDEEEYEKNPTKIRSMEVSEFQDEALDIETRGPEREVFEEKVFEVVDHALHPNLEDLPKS